MGIANIQTAFLGGEWSSFAQGRVDDEGYKFALKVCYNSIPLEAGLLVRRPGTRFIGATHNGSAAKIIPFNFKSTAPYNMELSVGALRFVTGVTQVTTNDNKTVSNISSATPAVVQTSAAHGWTTNQQVIFSGLGTVCPLLQNRQLRLTVIDATHFSLDDPLTNDLIDGAALGWPVGGSATVSRILQIATIYADADLPNIRSVQAEKLAVLLSTKKPYYITVTTEPTSSQFATFDGPGPVTFIDGPYFDPITDCHVAVSGLSGSITLTLGGSLDHINDGQGFVGSDVGRLVRLHNEPPLWDPIVTYPDGDFVTFGDIYYVAAHAIGVVNPNIGFIPSAYPNLWTVAPQQHIWQWGTITNVTNAVICTLSLDGGGLLFSNDIRTWRLGAYSDTTGWPTCGTYSDGRLWLAGAIDNRIDGSEIGTDDQLSIFKFAPTTNLGQVTAASAVAAVFNAPDVNAIRWMIPDQQGIICGTLGGEWLVQAASQSAALSALNIQARRVTKIGCANIEPRRTEHTMIFVQRYARKVMEYFADVYSGKFSAPNLSAKAKHLSPTGIEEIAYQQELAPIIWARTAEGNLIGATYKRDTLATSKGPDFCAWHDHALGSGRTVESICVGGSADGTLDTLAMVTFAVDTNVRNVEILTDIFDEAAALAGAWYLDNAVIPTSCVIGTVAAVEGVTFNGLWHLNGKTATVFVGGLDCGDFVVANGSCFVPFGDGISSGPGGGLFSAAYLNAMPEDGRIIIGQNFSSRGQVLRPITPEATGSHAGPALGKLRRVHQFSALLENTVGISFGTSFSKMYPALFRQPNGVAYAVNVSFSGVYQSTLQDDNSFDSQLCWQITRPYPANILAVTSFLQTQDR